ncbi:dihydrofolate reductase [Haloarcula litorea]|uniref:dihydrofolate reductase n=1 Tax=Haloarcula litorea TaxID=3032579 RepID=UPI0023E8A2A3|nr:dihydrofolate reductase [Halomicroarcula sp. GDY20]
MPELSLVAGVARTGAIGDGETIPWHYEADERQYKERVAGHPVVVGRKTWAGMTDVEGTHPVVFTSSPDEYDAEDATFVGSVPEAVAAVAERDDAGYVIGGQSVYATMLPYADRAFVSELPEYEIGSKVFPYLGTDWTVVGREAYDEFDVVEYRHENPRPVAAAED